MTQQTCSVFGCERVAKGRGLCPKHWARWRRHGDPHTVGSFGPENPGGSCAVHHCRAKPDPDGDGWCWEHRWRFAWPLPLPEHIPDEPEPDWGSGGGLPGRGAAGGLVADRQGRGPAGVCDRGVRKLSGAGELYRVRGGDGCVVS